MVCSIPEAATVEAADAEGYPSYESFDEMCLAHELLRGIYAFGMEKPSEIQRRAIRCIIDGRDTLIQAPSGTGKTAACIIGCLSRVNAFKQACQALILTPTRELATNMSTIVRSLGEFLKIQSHAVVGGTRIREDIQTLQAGQQVVVGTPGRTFDMVKRRALLIEHLQVLVVDEGDEMISRGFRDQILELLQVVTSDTQLCVCSATQPREMLELFQRFMREPVHLLVRREELTLVGIRQFYIAVEMEDWKLETLVDFFEAVSSSQTIVYCCNQRRAECVASELSGHGHTASSLHAGLDPEQQRVVTQQFNAGSTRVLVATDRPATISQTPLVVHYDMPPNMDAYLRRIGRSGCYGRRGTAIIFVTREDVQSLRDIERFFQTSVDELPVDISEIV